ncbi:MAG: hypothetical protein U1F71_04290 [Verrucomicrobiaceae bacterium]
MADGGGGFGLLDEKELGAGDERVGHIIDGLVTALAGDGVENGFLVGAGLAAEQGEIERFELLEGSAFSGPG